MKGLHRFVIVAGVAGLGFLCLVGAKANADNFYRVPPKKATVTSSRHSSTLESIRQKVKQANETDGGCG